MPRCTRSHSSPSNSRNICLPTARTDERLATVEHGRALDEAALRAARRDDAADVVAIELARDAVDGMPFGHQPASGSKASDDSPPRGRGRAGIRLQGAVDLVRGDLGDPARVALVAGERRRDEPVDEGRGLVEGVLAGADGDDVRVVVLARELGGRDAPDERRADAAHLVRRDLLAVAGSAEDDAERLDAVGLIAHDGLRGADAEGRVVIERLVVERPVVDDLVSLIAQVVLQLRGELEAGVVGRDVDAHGVNPREPGRRRRA